MKLRPYQSEALAASLKRWKAGVWNQLVAAATGTGKAVLIASLPKHHGFTGKMLVLVHMEELAEQAADKIRRCNPGVNVGIEMASRRCSPWDDIVVASVPTLGREGSQRIAKFRPDEFECIVQDEAHLSTADSFRRVYTYFGVGKPNAKRLFLGFTATPNRADGVPLAELFDEIVYQLPLRRAIEDGWLSDLKAVQVKTATELDKVRIRAGDFSARDLEDAINTPERNKLIVASWLKAAAPRRTLAFTVDIQHAQDLADAFRANGVRCEALWGTRPDRAEVLARHKAGELDVLTNCAVLTTGYDDPGLSCILMCRPTKSRLLFQQMIGRGTRLQDGVNNLHEAEAAGLALTKRDCLVVDFVDVAGRHSLAGVGSLVGMGDELDFAGKSLVKSAKRFEDALALKPNLDVMRLRSVDELDLALTQVDMFREIIPAPLEKFAGMTWNQYSEGSFLISLPGKGSAIVTQDLLGHWEARITPPAPPKDGEAVEGGDKNAAARTVLESVSVPPHFGTVEDAVAWSEALLQRAGFGTLLNAKAKWRKDEATEGQLRFMRKLGLIPPAGVSKGEASRAIDGALAQRGRR